jgi:hypothetical protein
MPSTLRSAPGRMGWRCAPSGNVGATQRSAGVNSAITPRHTVLFISTPWSSTTVGPSPPVSTQSIGPTVRSTVLTSQFGVISHLLESLADEITRAA